MPHASKGETVRTFGGPSVSATHKVDASPSSPASATPIQGSSLLQQQINANQAQGPVSQAAQKKPGPSKFVIDGLDKECVTEAAAHKATDPGGAAAHKTGHKATDPGGIYSADAAAAKDATAGPAHKSKSGHAGRDSKIETTGGPSTGHKSTSTVKQPAKFLPATSGSASKTETAPPALKTKSGYGVDTAAGQAKQVVGKTATSEKQAGAAAQAKAEVGNEAGTLKEVV
jgi:hypothetical protein